MLGTPQQSRYEDPILTRLPYEPDIPNTYGPGNDLYMGGGGGVSSPAYDNKGAYSYDWAQPWGVSGQPVSEPRKSPVTYFPSRPPRLTGVTTTSTTTPVKPGVPLPTLKAPKWDESRVAEYRRKYMAPVRGARQGLRRTLASLPSTQNIAVAKEMGRGAVEGFGTALSNISMRAGQQGLQEYERRRAEEMSVLMANFQAAMNDYMAQYGRKTVSEKKMQYGQQPKRDQRYALGPYGTRIPI